MAIETTRIESWLYSILSSDPGSGGINTLVNGRIYPYQAPQKTEALTYPVVIYSYQSARDVQGIGTRRSITSALYLVKVISKGAPTDREKNVADRIDEVVGHALNHVKDNYVFNAYRERPVVFNEVDSSTQQQYRHIGGLFVIETSPLV